MIFSHKTPGNAKHPWDCSKWNGGDAGETKQCRKQNWGGMG
jgi:hypothetical protein